MESLPETQRAWIVARKGAPSSALELKNTYPVPKQLKEEEVLLKVQAGALNPVGYKLMRLMPNFMASRPFIAENDISGVVIEANGTRFSNGDQVYGWVPVELQRTTHQGALAQYITVPADHIVLRPPNVTPVQACGITLTALTAYQGLFDIGNLEAGQTIFINGGSTATGAYAIQLAKAKGAKVVATASGKNEQFVRSMGADEFVDYTKAGPLHDYLSKNAPSPKYHVIYDAVGLLEPRFFSHSEKYLAPGGIFVSTGPMPKNMSFSEIWKILQTFGSMITPWWLGGVKRRYAVFLCKNNPAQLEEMRNMVADGSLRPLVDSVHELDDALNAYNRILSGRATGKVVVRVDSEDN